MYIPFPRMTRQNISAITTRIAELEPGSDLILLSRVPSRSRNRQKFTDTGEWRLNTRFLFTLQSKIPRREDPKCWGRHTILAKFFSLHAAHSSVAASVDRKGRGVCQTSVSQN